MLTRTGNARHRGEDERGFLTALDQGGIRRLGYAVDDNKQKIGIRRLAASVPDPPTTAAISASGPAGRVTDSANRCRQRLNDYTAQWDTNTERPQTEERTCR
ncbi:hypothetical protein SMALB_0267 [Streptomyces malaysiensis]|uniref:IclR-ED domain-containing protein n=1 Tax=Streptomyces malaysiensis TaxID=92644 RepID=A0A7X5WWM8_STRMQ|nr:hypothetical protein [Streptomyces malaysiensis]